MTEMIVMMTLAMAEMMALMPPPMAETTDPCLRSSSAFQLHELESTTKTYHDVMFESTEDKVGCVVWMTESREWGVFERYESEDERTTHGPVYIPPQIMLIER